MPHVAVSDFFHQPRRKISFERAEKSRHIPCAANERIFATEKIAAERDAIFSAFIHEIGDMLFERILSRKIGYETYADHSARIGDFRNLRIGEVPSVRA